MSEPGGEKKKIASKTNKRARRKHTARDNVLVFWRRHVLTPGGGS